MSENDSGIKLFGRKIPLPECQISADSHPDSQIAAKSGTTDACNGLKKTEVERSCAENLGQQDNSSDVGDSKLECQQKVQENESNLNPKHVKDKMETSGTEQDKTMKKPDKIAQCPRCNSLDTKFCYFNNYNVNQPRHFCKNCQRYWTAGGTIRNVPVGAGRRKNKHLPSQYRHIIVASDGIPITRLENTDSSGHQLLPSLESSATFRSPTDNGTVLKFGPDASLCESMESMLNLRDMKRSSLVNSICCAENGEEPSLNVSSVTSAGTQGNELSEIAMQRDRGVSSEPNASNGMQCYPIPPWVLPWNPGWNNVASMAASHQSSARDCNSMQWHPTPMVAVPGICPPNIPLQFVPASYWGGMPVLAAGAGAVPIGSNVCLSPSSSTTSNSCCSGNGSPTLGKHSRDTAYADEEKSENCVLAPKTLRIDDPTEASKSPIRATLGTKPHKMESVSQFTNLKRKDPRGETKDPVSEVSQALEANPAAISRAFAFQESL